MTNRNACYTTTLTDTETNAHDGECAGCDEDIALHVDWSLEDGFVPWCGDGLDALDTHETDDDVTAGAADLSCLDWSADEGSVPWHVENVDAVA